MGNIATPNTPHCLGFQQASLSVGNKTFSTQNPPISYSIDGSTVTVFDALGVLGITSYSSDDFVEISSSPASPNTNYCSSAKAILTWSSGTIETLNTPISYQLRSNIVEWGNSGIVQGSYTAPTAINSASIQSNTNKLLINGQVETFNKPVASWQNIPQSQNILRYQKHDGTWVELPYLSYSIVNRTGFSEFLGDLGSGYADSVGKSFLSRAGQPYTLFAGGDGGFGGTAVCDPVYASIDNWATRYIEPAIGLAINGQIRFFLGYEISTRIYGRSNLYFSSGIEAKFIDIFYPDNSGTYFVNVYIQGDHTRLKVENLDGSFTEFADFITYQEIVQSSCILRVTFSDNTTQDLTYQTCPTVQSLPGCTVAIVLANSTTENIQVNPCPDFVNVINNEVTVFDGTGQIFKTDYLMPPLNFQVTCYDFNVTEVSYVCQGDCPSGTEFRCVCPATNTIMCYGFDPENPNVFKPLFTTQITS
jgi:hypothetical protein